MLFTSLPTGTFEWITWVWRNREQLPELPLKAAELVQRTIENGGEGIRRVGSSVVFGTPDGGQRVLAFIDQVPQQLNSLAAGQQVIGSSLASLQTISTLSLGVSALSPVILGGQFFWLRSQFRNIQRRLDRLERVIDDQTISRLKAGLDALQSGSNKRNNRRIESAFIPCGEALHTFSSRLGELLDEPKKKQDRKVILPLTQHLSVALCAAARCDIALGNDDDARGRLEAHRPVLIKSSQAVFGQTLKESPGRFLTRDLTDDGSGVEFLRASVQQAKDNGVIESQHPLAEASRSLPDFVQYLLGEGRARGFIRWRSCKRLKDELRDAAVSLEDCSRVLSLEAIINKARDVGTVARDLIEQVERRKQSAKSPFVAWAV